MSTVAMTRTVVVVGSRPRARAAEILGDVRPGEETAVYVLGLDPTPAQRRLTGEALAIAAERRFVLTAELVGDPTGLRERLREGDEVRVFARARESRRWRVEQGLGVNAPGA